MTEENRKSSYWSKKAIISLLVVGFVNPGFAYAKTGSEPVISSKQMQPMGKRNNNGERQRQRQEERQRQRQEQRQRQKQEERQRQRQEQRQRQKQEERQRQRQEQRQRQKQEERQRQRQEQRQRQKQEERQRQRQEQRQRQKQEERQRQRQEQRQRQKQEERQRQRDQERDKQKEQDRQKQRERNRDQDRNRDRDRGGNDGRDGNNDRHQRQKDRSEKQKQKAERQKRRELREAKQERQRKQRKSKDTREAREHRKQQQVKHREMRRKRHSEERRNRWKRSRAEKRERFHRDREHYHSRRHGKQHWRERWHRHHRRIQRPRHHYGYRHWHRHYSYWWHYYAYYRPAVVYVPSTPIYVDVTWPAPKQEKETWTFTEILETAEALEQHSLSLYELADETLRSGDSWNDGAVSALFDIAQAAMEYNQALNDKPADLEESVQELFVVHQMFEDAAQYINDSRMPNNIVENFDYAEYYKDELMWTYRQELGDLESLQNEYGFPSHLASFWWSKPHRTLHWNVGAEDSDLVADELVLQSVNTNGMRGRNGVMGIRKLVVYYQDGTQQDMVSTAHQIGDTHVYSKSGQLVLDDEGDAIRLPLVSGKSISSVEMQADSWISQNVDSFVLLTFEWEVFDEEDGNLVQP